MSVVVLYATDKEAYMGSDSQSTNIKTAEVGEPTIKVIKPNDHILVGSAGYALIVSRILNILKTVPENLYVMDILKLITRFTQNKIQGDLPVSTSILLAGKDNTRVFQSDIAAFKIKIGEAPVQLISKTHPTRVVLPPPDTEWDGLERFDQYLKSYSIKESMEHLVSDYSIDSKYVGGDFQFESIHI